MSDLVDNIKDIGKDIIGDVGKRFLDDEFYRGYDKATNICISRISFKVEDLREKIKGGKSLSKEEQFLMIQLEDLQRELEDSLSRARMNIRVRIVEKES